MLKTKKVITPACDVINSNRAFNQLLKYGQLWGSFLLKKKINRKRKLDILLFEEEITLRYTRNIKFFALIVRLIKIGLSPSKKCVFICFNESLLKWWKMLKALFILEIFKFLFWRFGYVSQEVEATRQWNLVS